jgi:hypothetical protein
MSDSVLKDKYASQQPKKLKKVGVLMVTNGKYTKEGVEKNRYHQVGVVFATPHHSRICIKFDATIAGEGAWANVFYDEGKAPNFAQENTPDDEATCNSNLQEMPAQPIGPDIDIAEDF